MLEIESQLNQKIFLFNREEMLVEKSIEIEGKALSWRFKAERA